ncbi:MAG: DUF5610 domain-containing protein [Thiotrichaceae bacterium]|nr:DUF5610 domain-containing protein [Thiotrichaceae bacterium]
MNITLSGASELVNSLNRSTVNSTIHSPQKSISGTPEANARTDTSIEMLSPEKTQALLNKQIEDKLKQRFAEEGIELQGLQAADFTPEKVSERILGFVSSRVLSEQDKDKQSELMTQAREGIEQGFAEAKDILQSLGVLNGQVKEDIDTSYELIQQGLSRLDDQLNGIVNDDSEAEKGSSQIQQAAMQSSYSRNENTQLEIITKDGDKVLIDLNKQQSAQSTRSYSNDGNAENYTESRSISASSGLSYQLQGELDEDEQKAIDELLNDIAKVSDSFFSGKVQKAFDLAVNMDFDSEELTRFSLNMNYQETSQIAISTYNTYQAQTDRELEQHPGQGQGHAYGRGRGQGLGQGQGHQYGLQAVQEDPGQLKDMNEFISELDKVFQNPFVMHKFNQPEDTISSLLQEMNQLLHADEIKQLKEESSSLLDSLVEQLKNYHTNKTVPLSNAAATDSAKELI